MDRNLGYKKKGVNTIEHVEREPHLRSTQELREARLTSSKDLPSFVISLTLIRGTIYSYRLTSLDTH
jgi:hypothetical protein